MALLVVRYISTAAVLITGPVLGPLAGAAVLVAAGIWLAPWVGRRLHVEPGKRTHAGLGPPLSAGALAAAAVSVLVLIGGVRLSFAGLHSGVITAAAFGLGLGYAEEAFIRGTAFGVLRTRSGPVAAIWGAAILLALVELLTGMPALGLLVTVALGLWWGLVRETSGGFLPAAAAHAAWNVVLGPVLGLGGAAMGGSGHAIFRAAWAAPWWAGPPGMAQAGLAALVVAAAVAAWARWRRVR